MAWDYALADERQCAACLSCWIPPQPRLNTTHQELIALLRGADVKLEHWDSRSTSDEDLKPSGAEDSLTVEQINAVIRMVLAREHTVDPSSLPVQSPPLMLNWDARLAPMHANTRSEEDVHIMDMTIPEVDAALTDLYFELAKGRQLTVEDIVDTVVFAVGVPKSRTDEETNRTS